MDSYRTSFGSVYHDSGEYALTATTTTGSTSGAETEDNNSQSNADSITSGVAIKGQLSSSTDKDYYKITTSGAGKIAVTFDAPTNTYTDYFKLKLTDSSGTVLAAQETGKDTSFSAGVGSAGNYYVYCLLYTSPSPRD